LPNLSKKWAKKRPNIFEVRIYTQTSRFPFKINNHLLVCLFLHTMLQRGLLITTVILAIWILFCMWSRILIFSPKQLATLGWNENTTIITWRPYKIRRKIRYQLFNGTLWGLNMGVSLVVCIIREGVTAMELSAHFYFVASTGGTATRYTLFCWAEPHHFFLEL
jgi:hypothetical protein